MPESETCKGSCYCGAVRWEATGKPIISAYCHCTLCQRLTGCPFVHTVHFNPSEFSWTHGEPEAEADKLLDCYAVADKPWKKRWRCKNCGACIASYHEKNVRWSLWGAHFERDEDGKMKYWDTLKPTHHIFYGTRQLDINDSLPKWSGYQDTSEKLG